VTTLDTAHADELVTAAAVPDTGGQAEAIAAAAVGKQLQMPLPPTFDTVEEERMHRKVQLAAAFRMFSKAGLDEGVAGHVTVRDPEFPDSYWVNPFGMHFSLIKQSTAPRSPSTAPCTPPGPTWWPPPTRTGPTARRCPASTWASSP
jgi:hypothetical protein